MTVRLARLAGLGAFLAATWASAPLAATAPDLGGRLTVDGHTADFTADESVFGLSASGTPEERSDDSAWGPYEELYQVRITWDRRNLYLAVEAMIWGNNVVLAVDVLPGRGLTSMRSLNSWARLFDFIPEFAPDLLCATWDGNPTGHLILPQSDTYVWDCQMGGSIPFRAASTFDQGNAGRATEFSIPWAVVFRGTTRDTVLDPGGAADTATVLPPGADVRLAAFITAAGDNTGGPDSAPNNLGGHTADGTDPVMIDNFARIGVDEDGDGLADVGVAPRSRVQFHDTSTPAQRPSWGRLKARYR